MNIDSVIEQLKEIDKSISVLPICATLFLIIFTCNVVMIDINLKRISRGIESLKTEKGTEHEYEQNKN